MKLLRLKNGRILAFLLGAASLLLVSPPSASAVPITLQRIGIAPYKTLSVHVTGFHRGRIRAGVSGLSLNGVLVDGFCIDPFHFSTDRVLPYTMVPLTEAPKDDHLIPGAHMTASEAATISELWGLAYPLIGSDSRKAAALQIAIWKVVGGDQFHLTSRKDYGASRLLATVNAPNYNGPLANLIALTGPGQDYVIWAPPLPQDVPISEGTPPPNGSPPTGGTPPSQEVPENGGTPPSQAVPDSGGTLTLFGSVLAFIALFRVATRERRRC